MAEYIETHDQKEFLPEKQAPAVFFRFLKNLFSAMGYDVRIETFENHKDFTTSIRATWEDVAPVRHGRWEKYKQGYPCHSSDNGHAFIAHFDNFKCSECGGRFEKKSSYCPNCGTKMDLEDKNG